MLKDTNNRMPYQASAELEFPLSVAEQRIESQKKEQVSPLSKAPKPWMYVSVFVGWLLCIWWFQPRLWLLLEMADSRMSWLALFSFILFIDFAWLYGLYNIFVVVFSLIHRRWATRPESALVQADLVNYPAVALLYTTCNDLVEKSLDSCVAQDYPNYKVYILDDSSDPDYKARVDAYAARYPDQVEVVRRPNREGFKAGNMNHGLENIATTEPYFAIADADEILPDNFLKGLVPVLEADPKVGFVQANHRANPDSNSRLAKNLGVGIDIHWKWYQPLRNDYGFVMFLGHGAILRRKCWEEIGGFPHIVSEDLGFAIHAREKGYRGRFVEEVVCYEDFPDTVRAFRIRHMKWTRGTCEFLSQKMGWLLRAKNISWTEKLDILFPTLNLPLTLLYFLFMLNANLLLPYFFGHEQILTFEIGGAEQQLSILSMDPRFNVIYSPDFFIITMMTFFAPVLCFILALLHKPGKLFRFLSHSTALYAALGPLSSIGVLTYMVSRKAVFLVTGDNSQKEHQVHSAGFGGQLDRWKDSWKQFLQKSHPDSSLIQGIEILTGLGFALVCVLMFQISFFGLCLAFLLLPIMHHLGWDNKLVRGLVYLPFLLILLGIFLAGLSMVGMQAVFFGYGFHF
ncbi:MAG: glycosyltransferase [Bacteroidetes bacterium]|nr:glycosyltransferase [Bacteroidota bacterium]